MVYKLVSNSWGYIIAIMKKDGFRILSICEASISLLSSLICDFEWLYWDFINGKLIISTPQTCLINDQIVQLYNFRVSQFCSSRLIIGSFWKFVFAATMSGEVFSLSIPNCLLQTNKVFSSVQLVLLCSFIHLIYC